MSFLPHKHTKKTINAQAFLLNYFFGEWGRKRIRFLNGLQKLTKFYLSIAGVRL